MVRSYSPCSHSSHQGISLPFASVHCPACLRFFLSFCRWRAPSSVVNLTVGRPACASASIPSLAHRCIHGASISRGDEVFERGDDDTGWKRGNLLVLVCCTSSRGSQSDSHPRTSARLPRVQHRNGPIRFPDKWRREWLGLLITSITDHQGQQGASAWVSGSGGGNEGGANPVAEVRRLRIRAASPPSASKFLDT